MERPPGPALLTRSGLYPAVNNTNRAWTDPNGNFYPTAIRNPS